MNRIEFRNGESITFKEAADLVRKEGRVGRYKFVDEEGVRCLWGILEDWSIKEDGISYYHIRRFTNSIVRYHASHYGFSSFAVDTFEGTLEERAEHFASLLENIKEVGL